MKWGRTMSADHFYQHQEGYSEPDDVAPITKATDWARANSETVAVVTVSAQRSTEYGGVKCTVGVTLECPQTNEWIKHTAKVGFKLALEFTNDGFSYLCPDAERIEGPK